MFHGFGLMPKRISDVCKNKLHPTARHLERLRPGLCLPSHVIVKMEEWRSGYRVQRSSRESINSVSQSWLPLVFISIFVFLVIRAICCFAGIDTLRVLDFLNKVLRI